MGKMKDLVTDVTYTLAGKTKVTVKAGRSTKEEEAYTYSGSNGGALVFHAHPTRAWNWVITYSNDIGRASANAVIDAFCKAGSNRGEQSFDDAIKVLHLS